MQDGVDARRDMPSGSYGGRSDLTKRKCRALGVGKPTSQERASPTPQRGHPGIFEEEQRIEEGPSTGKAGTSQILKSVKVCTAKCQISRQIS